VPVSVLTYADDPSFVVFTPRAWWTLDAEGRVLFGYPGAYEIEVHDPDGTLLRRIRREYDPVKVSREERADLTERTRKVLGPEAAAEMSFAEEHSAFRSFFTDDEGRLFVQTWERTGDGEGDIHDVFDAEGRFIGRVPMPVHPDFQAPTPRVMRGGKLYAIEPDEEGYEVVKRYSVTWKVK
ncbi:MAG TPA: hypothetical protein VE134_05510, partial [Methanomicrobiales archaeon]|nr:hypothetical protein [Methanomicrobiales archaeon]